MVLEYSAFSIKSTWGDLLNYSVGTGPQEHVVKFYKDEACFYETVIKYVLEGIAKTEGIVLVATQAHIEGFEQRLLSQAAEYEKVQAKGQLLLLDADKMLNQFMIEGRPNANRFHQLLGNLMSKMRLRYAKIRAFGEMVNILCEKQNFSAAISLEHLWNDLAIKHPFSLLCAYDITNFRNKMRQTPYRQICHAHSHITSPQ